MSEPEPWFFEGLGRVVVLVARLELQVAEIVALFEKATYERVNTLAANWRRTLDAFDAAVRGLAPGVLRSELTALRDDVESVREERNRLAHSVAVVDIQAEWNPERTWFHYHPRTDGRCRCPRSLNCWLSSAASGG